MKRSILLFTASLLLALALFDAGAKPVSASEVTIVYPAGESPNDLLAAKEVRRYVYLRSGRLLGLQAVRSLLPTGDLIVVSASSGSLVKGLRKQLRHDPNDGQTLLKSVVSGNRNVLVVSGSDPNATLVAACRYAEKIGVGFDLAGDAIPNARAELSLLGFDEVGQPLFETRGIQPFHDFFQGPDLWNTRDYRSVISQLPKLGMNFIGLKTYPHYSTYEERVREFGPIGPELTVWIGLPDDVKPHGTVKWSYPAYFAHTKRRSWASGTRLSRSKTSAVRAKNGRPPGSKKTGVWASRSWTSAASGPTPAPR